MTERNNIVLKIVAAILSSLVVATIIWLTSSQVSSQTDIAVLKSEKTGIIQRLESIEQKVDKLLQREYNRRDRSR